MSTVLLIIYIIGIACYFVGDLIITLQVIDYKKEHKHRKVGMATKTANFLRTIIGAFIPIYHYIIFFAVMFIPWESLIKKANEDKDVE